MAYSYDADGPPTNETVLFEMLDIDSSNIIYGKRDIQPPERYENLVFIKGSNNHHCIGRDIDPYVHVKIKEEPYLINQSPIDIDWTLSDAEYVSDDDTDSEYDDDVSDDDTDSEYDDDDVSDDDYSDYDSDYSDDDSEYE